MATPGRRRGKKAYHVNLVKQWKDPPQALVPNMMSVVEEDDADEELTDLNLWEQEEIQFDGTKLETPNLSSDEQRQLLHCYKIMSMCSVQCQEEHNSD